MRKNLKAIFNVAIALAMLSFVMTHKEDIAGCMANSIAYSLYDLQATAFGDEYHPPAPQNTADKISIMIYNITKKTTTNGDLDIDGLKDLQRKLEDVAGDAMRKVKQEGEKLW